VIQLSNHGGCFYCSCTSGREWARSGREENWPSEKWIGKKTENPSTTSPGKRSLGIHGEAKKREAQKHLETWKLTRSG